ncbi:hypothetical protein B6D51_21715 [Pseudomonas chlororaphis subsp. chlororaphis]|nr:hypothetical protein B6D51_21715 [Pseudomonas chlororaphis subsp. chlororaphis]
MQAPGALGPPPENPLGARPAPRSAADVRSPSTAPPAPGPRSARPRPRANPHAGRDQSAGDPAGIRRSAHGSGRSTPPDAGTPATPPPAHAPGRRHAGLRAPAATPLRAPGNAATH